MNSKWLTTKAQEYFLTNKFYSLTLKSFAESPPFTFFASAILLGGLADAIRVRTPSIFSHKLLFIIIRVGFSGSPFLLWGEIETLIFTNDTKSWL